MSVDLDYFNEAIRANPFSRTEREIFADWCDEHDMSGWADALRATQIPLVDIDIDAIKTLRGCSVWENDFVGQLYRDWVQNLSDDKNQPSKFLRHGIPRLTPRQFMWLWILCRRYRRQIKDETIKATAEARYEPYCKMLDIAHLPLNKRKRTKKTDDRAYMWDDDEVKA